MRNSAYSGNLGFVIALILMSAMTLMSYFSVIPAPEQESHGFLFAFEPWRIPRPVSVIARWLLIVAISVGMVLVNRRYNFIPTLTTLHASVFMILCAADPGMSRGIGPGILFAVVNLVALFLLFKAFRHGGKPSESASAIFLIALFCSSGSMFQYAFVFLIPLYAICAAMMKIFRFREVGALVIGTATPYWIFFGLKDMSFPGFRLPEFVPFSVAPGMDNAIFMIYVSSLAVIGFLLSMKNIYSLLSSNLQLRMLGRGMILTGIGVSALFMIDASLVAVFAVAVYMFTSFQTGYLSGFSRQRGSGWILSITFLFSLTFLILMLNGL